MYHPLTFRKAIYLVERLCGRWVRHLRVRVVYTLLLITLGLSRQALRHAPQSGSPAFAVTILLLHVRSSAGTKLSTVDRCLFTLPFARLLFQHPDYVTTTLGGNHNVLNIPQLSCTFAGSVIRSYKRWRLLVFPCSSVSCIRVHACLLPMQFSLVLDVTSF